MKLGHIFLFCAATLFVAVVSAAPQYNNLSINDKNLYPEGITLDDQGHLYLSSFTQGKILTINIASQQQSNFANPGQDGMVSTIGLFADNDDHTLWACSSDPGVSAFTGKSPVALKHFDLSNRQLLGSFELPGGGFCNDITQDSQGNIYVTDSWNPRILKLNKGGKNLVPWLTNQQFDGKGFNLNGIDFDGQDTIYVNKSNSGQLFAININNKQLSEIKLPRPLLAPDGLKVLDKNTLLTVEAATHQDDAHVATAGTGTVTQVTLNGKKNTGQLTTIADHLDLPTTFVLNKDKTVLWVVEAQYDHLFNSTKTPPHLFRIVKVPLPERKVH